MLLSKQPIYLLNYSIIKNFIAFIKRNNDASNDRFSENQFNEVYGCNLMDGAIPIEVSVLCVLRREENSRYRLLLVV
jgi:hypothetical protein